jgi:hypothetical protein
LIPGKTRTADFMAVPSAKTGIVAEAPTGQRYPIDGGFSSASLDQLLFRRGKAQQHQQGSKP